LEAIERFDQAIAERAQNHRDFGLFGNSRDSSLYDFHGE
jgi:hypothetical protein